MGNNKSQLVVAAIENGTVIDHIPAEKTYQVVNLLQLEKMETPVTIGYNLPSKKIGKKGIIKVANDVIDRLSRHHQKAGRIRLGLGYANGVTDKNGRTNYSHEITIEPTAERKLLIDHLLGIFHQAWSGAAVRNISIALSRLSDANTQQISLF